MNEQAYERGSRAAYLVILSECLRQLGYADPEVQKVAWIKEREAAIAALRSMCALHGDNDWSDNLHLADIINKHLV